LFYLLFILPIVYELKAHVIANDNEWSFDSLSTHMIFYIRNCISS